MYVFFVTALPVLSESPVDSGGFGLKCLPTLRAECKVKQHPNGSMVQTIPKLFHLPSAVAGTLGRKIKTETPTVHILCRFPGDYDTLWLISRGREFMVKDVEGEKIQP